MAFVGGRDLIGIDIVEQQRNGGAGDGDESFHESISP